MTYRKDHFERVEHLIKDGIVFNNDAGNGVYRGKPYSFILQNSDNNIYAPNREEILEYFSGNDVSWWGGKKPTSHPLSSQIACLNHLFPIRQDADAILGIIKQIDPEIAEALPILSDKFLPAYVQFESVSDADHLNELLSTRGSNCTSVDALIYGRRSNGSKVIFSVEWKYTEVYENEDKAKGERGVTRKHRYTALINQSKQLSVSDHSIFYFEPFYQLMRQTLWAEQMIAFKESETVQADDFIHVHVIPKENRDLLNKIYPCSGKEMEPTWRSCLVNQDKYRIVTPEKLLEPLDRKLYQDVIDYLDLRYWRELT